MIDFFKNVRWSLLFIGVLTVVIRVAMVMYPDTASDTIVRILGGIMAVAAVFSIIGYLLDRARGRNAFTSLFVGALMLIMGAVLYFNPASFVEFLGYIFAALVLVQGINLIVEAFSSKKYETSHWGQTLLMGLICVIMAVIIFINPFAEFRMLMIITGIALIVAGLLNIFVSARIGLAVHRFNMAIKDVEAGLGDAAEIVDALESEAEAIGEAEGTKAIRNEFDTSGMTLSEKEELGETILEAVEQQELKENLEKAEVEAEVVKDAASRAIDAEAFDIKENNQSEGMNPKRSIPDKLSDIKLDFSENNDK